MFAECDSSGKRWFGIREWEAAIMTSRPKLLNKLRGFGWPLGGGVQPSSFNPALYGTVVSWWDFSDNTTTYQGLGGTGTKAIANNDPIGSITDKSGGHTLVAAANGNRATLKTAVQNGNNIGQFNGTSSVFQALFTLNQPFTILMVYKSLVIGASGINDGICDGGTNLTALLADTTPQTYLYAGASLTYNANICNGVFGQITCIFNTIASAIFENGVSRVAGGASGNNAGGYTLAALNGLTRWTNIQVGEVVIYSTLTNQVGAQAAMKAKWGTP